MCQGRSKHGTYGFAIIQNANPSLNRHINKFTNLQIYIYIYDIRSIYPHMYIYIYTYKSTIWHPHDPWPWIHDSIWLHVDRLDRIHMSPTFHKTSTSPFVTETNAKVYCTGPGCAGPGTLAILWWAADAEGVPCVNGKFKILKWSYCTI